MGSRIHFANYSPAADIVVAAICFVMIVLVGFSYISRTRSFKLFLTMVGLVLVAAWTDMAFYSLVTMPNIYVVANWVRCIYHGCLFLIFVYYIAYICEVTHYENQQRSLFLANVVFAIVMLADIITTAQGLTFAVGEAGIHFIGRDIFFYGYIAFALLCIVLMARVREHLFRRVMFGFYGTMAISFGVLLVQGISGQASFTVATFLFPVIAMMYVLHSNPYDALLGTNDLTSMLDFVQYCQKKKQDFIFMSLYMKEFDEEGTEIPDEMQAYIRHFTYRVVKKARIFKAGKGHLILVFLKKQYPNYEEKIKSVLDAFFPIYDKFRYDYKIVIGESIDEISKQNAYVSYIRNIHRSMPECSAHRVGSEDIIEFKRTEYILKELADIYRTGDLNDPRVLVYCQPVLNV